MVSSFRLIQPATQQSLPLSVLAGSGDAVAPSEKLGKRIRTSCRPVGTVCDGRRPQCGTCAAKLRSCRYESKASQPRRAALKSRLQALEKLFSALQAKPAQDADLLLQQIRSSDDIGALLDLKDDLSSRTAGTGSEEQSVGSSSSLHQDTVSRSLRETDVGGDALRKANLPTSAPRHRGLSVDVSRSLVSLVIPSAITTQVAVDSFFSSSGRHFHVFSREQVLRYQEDVFVSDGCTVASKKMAICCLAAVAAVGVQYNGDDFDVGTDGIFYDVARHFFENLMEEQPLDAIKACTLLAMYNIMNKATVSLAYIGLWFHDALSVDVEGDHSSEVSHIVQTEMTKISLLNADILRMHLSSEEMTQPCRSSRNSRETVGTDPRPIASRKGNL
ncbi:hypothetical protein ACJZ2D_016634 [Fusarium nematophilum]